MALIFTPLHRHQTDSRAARWPHCPPVPQPAASSGRQRNGSGRTFGCLSSCARLSDWKRCNSRVATSSPSSSSSLAVTTACLTNEVADSAVATLTLTRGTNVSPSVLAGVTSCRLTRPQALGCLRDPAVFHARKSMARRLHWGAGSAVMGRTERPDTHPRAQLSCRGIFRVR